MSYVNKIAEITHSVVDRYGGSANKNIGDAFLLCWKFPEPKEIEEMDLMNDCMIEGFMTCSTWLLLESMSRDRKTDRQTDCGDAS